MARRVNTKFVMILCAAVTAAVGGVGGVMLYRHRQNQNPMVLKARAEEAEKAGNMKTAVALLGQAADLASKQHLLGADEIYAHAADICMSISKTAKLDDDAIQYYQLARSYNQRALAENPRNMQVNTTMLEEDYAFAKHYPNSLSAWKDLEDVAGKQISNQDGAKARTDHALARWHSLTQATATEQTFNDIDIDLVKALEFDPTSGQAMALHAEVQWAIAKLRAVQKGMDIPAFRLVAKGAASTKPATGPATLQDELPKEVLAAQRYLFDGVTDEGTPPKKIASSVKEIRAELNEFMDKHGPDADVALTLMDIDLYHYTLMHERNTDPKKEQENRQKELTPIVALLEKAQAADPTNEQVAAALTSFYQSLDPDHPEKGEKLYKQIVQLKPDGPEAYILLGNYYRLRGLQTSGQRQKDLTDAIVAYKEAMKHQQIGSGLDSVKNREFQQTALDWISWLNMDLASLAGMEDAQIKAYLKESGEYADRLRSTHASRGLVDLLDGRAQFMNHNLAAAEKTLLRAQANLSGADEYQIWLRSAKLLLASAYEQEALPQLGAAITLYREAIKIQPENRLIIKLGTLLVRSQSTAQSDEARVLMEGLLGDQHKTNGIFDGTFEREWQLSPQICETAKRIWATAMSNMENNQPARKVLEHLAQLTDDKGSQLQLMWTEISSDEPSDNAAAAAEAMKVIEKQTGYTPDEVAGAYQVAVMGYSRLGNKDKAAQLVEEGLGHVPNNPQLQYLKEQVASANGAVSREALLKIIQAMPDDYRRHDQLANYYHGKDWDKEIEELKEAEKLVEGKMSNESQDRLATVIDRIFVAASMAAVGEKDNATKRDAYWALAQAYVAKAQNLNLDGVDGKLYQGRLELAKTDYRSGLAKVDQAVQLRPDYAFAHLVRGQAYFNQQDWDAALIEFQQVIRLAPNNVPAMEYAIGLLMRKGDQASRKEAQGYLNAGLRLAPNDTRLADFADELQDDVDKAIQTREKDLARDPTDRKNLQHLAMLYIRKMGTSKRIVDKLEAINKGINIVQDDVQKRPDDLDGVDLLARLLAEKDGITPKTLDKDSGTVKALQLYSPFISSADKTIRLYGLIARAEFVNRLSLDNDSIKFLLSLGLLSKPVPADEAVANLQEAIGLEQEGMDLAERHLGDIYFEDNKMADAEKIYLLAVNKNKDSDTRDKLVRRLIETELRQDKITEAMTYLDDLLKRHPGDVQGLILRGFAFIQQRNSVGAIKVLNEVLAQSEGNPDALYYRALAELKIDENYDAGVKDLIAARLHDSTANSAVLLAQTYSSTQKYGEAAVVYEEILKDRPDMVKVRTDYTEFLMYLAVLQTKLPEKSNEEFVRAIREMDPVAKLDAQLKDAQVRFPGNLLWYLMYADLESLRGNDRMAQARYKILYDNFSNNVQLCDAYILSLIKTGAKEKADLEKAVEITTGLIKNETYPELIKEDPTYVVFYIRRAAALLGLNREAEAKADIDSAFAAAVKALESRKDLSPFIIVLNEAASIYPDRATGQKVVAERLQARLAAHPDETISQIGLLQMLMLSNQNAQAMALADKIKVPGEQNLELRAHVLRETGLARYQAKAYPAAAKDFEALLKIAPDDVDSLNNYAFMLADAMGQPEKAIDNAKKALHILATQSDATKVMASSANVYDTLGWAMLLDSPPQIDNAITTLRRATNTHPMPATYYHLAVAYQKAKRKDEALQAAIEGLSLEQLMPDEAVKSAAQENKERLRVTRGEHPDNSGSGIATR